MYTLNVDVDSRNSTMLNALTRTPNSEQYYIQACDAIATIIIDLSTLTNKRTDTGDLHSVHAQISDWSQSHNFDVSDGLVNGARSEVIPHCDNKPTHVHVNFD